MADIVKDLAEYRIKQIEIAESKYYGQLITVLDKIENQIVSLAGSDLPTDKGKLFDLKIAIAIRPKIKAVLEKEYLAWSDRVVREGYNKQAKRIEKAFIYTSQSAECNTLYHKLLRGKMGILSFSK